MNPTHQLQSILYKIVKGQDRLNNETFKPWLEKYFSKQNQNVKDVFQIKIKEEEEEKNDAYSKCNFHFINFRVKYGNTNNMDLYFLENLQKLLLYLLPLIPDDEYLQPSIEHLNMIINSIEIYNSKNPKRIDIPTQPNYELGKIGFSLFTLFYDRVIILDIFDRLINESHMWDFDKMKSEISVVLNEIFKSDNNNQMWLRFLFGPLKNPSAAMNEHNNYIMRHREKLLLWLNNQNFKFYEPDIDYLIWSTINYFNKMLEQINVQLLTPNQRNIYYYAKNFFNDIEKKPERKWADCLQDKLDKLFPIEQQPV